MTSPHNFFFFFFFNDTATTEIYTLSLHDALPICRRRSARPARPGTSGPAGAIYRWARVARIAEESPLSSAWPGPRSEEHTSELQSRLHLVCRLLLEKKKKHIKNVDNSSTYQGHNV